jgi:CubicO group peptidase (beta-lactamase class C family)
MKSTFLGKRKIMPQKKMTQLHRRYPVGLLLALILLVLSLPTFSASFVLGAEVTATPTPAVNGDYWPTTDWRTSSPEDQQMDSQKLAQMLDTVRDEKINLHSLLIIRHGYIVNETYFPPYAADRKHELYSVTKSYVSTLVGIAIDQGYIDSLDHRVLDYFPDKTFKNVDDRKKAMTVGDLVTMRAGLDWDESSSLNPLFRASDWVTYMLDLPMKDQPGTTFNYCTGCSHILSAVLEKATNSKLADFADKVLFKPLGISDIFWQNAPEGTPVGGFGLRLVSRDMAKLGYLFLHNGQWDGQTIVSADWVQKASTMEAKTGGDLDYGYMWWIDPHLKAYTALGYDGQTVFVIPDLDLMIVTTAAIAEHNHDSIFDLIENEIVPAVKDLPKDFISTNS